MKRQQEFWDKKILHWEADKYSHSTFFDTNKSLKYRLSTAANLIRKHGKGKRLLELGCGSGLLLDAVIESGAQEYVGIDFSTNAILAAKERAQLLGGKTKIEFLVCDTRNLKCLSADLTFSLGFLDWLEIKELRKLLECLPSQHYFHSFSERKPYSFAQIIHKLYVYFFYGYKMKGYVPKYYSREIIENIFVDSYAYQPRFFSDPRLSFGTFIYSLNGDFQ